MTLSRSALGAFTLASIFAAVPAFAQTAPTCQPHEAQVFAQGCDGPARLVCDGGASLPAGSEWCGCDGRTAQSWSMAPPSGVRYRFRGACEVTARFEFTDERRASGGRTGRVVVIVTVGSETGEVTRVAGPCRAQRLQGAELARATCGSTTLVMSREGDDVVVREGARELSRNRRPAGQRVVGAR